MKWNVGTKIGVGFGLALAIFVIVGFISYRATTELVTASDWRKHTTDVLSRLDQTLSSLKDVETGQRGDTITGDERYLDPYVAALPKIDRSIQDARTILGNAAT